MAIGLFIPFPEPCCQCIDKRPMIKYFPYLLFGDYDHTCFVLRNGGVPTNVKPTPLLPQIKTCLYQASWWMRCSLQARPIHSLHYQIRLMYCGC